MTEPSVLQARLHFVTITFCHYRTSSLDSVLRRFQPHSHNRLITRSDAFLYIEILLPSDFPVEFRRNRRCSHRTGKYRRQFVVRNRDVNRWNCRNFLLRRELNPIDTFRRTEQIKEEEPFLLGNKSTLSVGFTFNRPKTKYFNKVKLKFAAWSSMKNWTSDWKSKIFSSSTIDFRSSTIVEFCSRSFS